MKLTAGQTILFQGDSITDAGRNREAAGFPSLGGGYPLHIAARLTAAFPEMNLCFINKGISGNRVKDLKSRWTEDCVQLRPDVVSILIGINDTWRAFDRGDPTSAEAYYEDYRHILLRVKNELGAAIVMLEPFVLPVPEDRKAWRADLDPKIAAARELAREFKATYIPLDGLFAAASAQQPCAVWAADGVHPTQAGHALIANAWIKAMS